MTERYWIKKINQYFVSELSEEWALAKNNQDNLDLSESNEVDNGLVTFNLKYLGSTLVERAANETVTADAIKTILRVAKASGKKLPRVNVAVSLNGIKVTDQEAKDILEISIYRLVLIIKSISIIAVCWNSGFCWSMSRD